MFRNKMEQLHNESGLTLIESAPHGFLNKQGWFDQAIEKAVEHFKTQLVK